MPIRQGFNVNGVLLGSDNPLLSGELSGYAIDYTHIYPVPFVPLIERKRLRGMPAKSNARARAGQAVPSYMDDLYYRVYITPKVIDFGAVVPPQTRSFSLWNAWPRENRVLNAITYDPSNEGLVIDGPALPTTFLPLQEITYNITITEEVPAAFEVTITFDFDNTQDPTLLVTGTAAVLFPFSPNWAQMRFNETLSWKSTVEASFGGREARSSVRRWPRTNYQYAIRTHSADAQAFDNVMIGWASRMLALPNWHETMSLSTDVGIGATVINVETTSYTNLAPGVAVVFWRSPQDFEVAEVLSFTANTVTLGKPLTRAWDKRAKFMVCSICAMNDNTNSTRAGTIFIDSAINAQVSPRQSKTRIVDLPATHTYLGYELYLGKVNWRSPMSNVQRNNESRTDADPAFFQVNRKGPYPVVQRSAEFMAKTRAAAEILRGFFFRRRGRAQPVWLTTEMDDFTLMVDAALGVSTLDVKRNQANVYMGVDHPLRQNILIRRRTGEHFATKITGYTDIGNGLLRLALAAPLPFSLTPQLVKRFSYLGFYRLAADEVTFTWATDRVCEINVGFVTLQVPTP